MVTLSNRTIATFLCQRILKESQKSLKKGIDCSHNCQKNRGLDESRLSTVL